MRIVVSLICLLIPLFCSAEEETSKEALHEECLEIKNEFQLDGETEVVSLENLVGTVRLEMGSSDQIESVVQVHAIDKDKARAKALVSKVAVVSAQEMNKLKLSVEYPLSEHSIYYYPASNEGKKSGAKGRSRQSYRGKEVTIFSDMTPAAVHLYADMTIKVPKRMRVEIKNAVGRVVASLFAGELSVETGLASVQLEKTEGVAYVTTGMGSITADGIQGKSAFTTGSGKISIEGGNGAILCETGAGTIALKKCDLTSVELSTGSGAITLDRSRMLELLASSGSGKITLDDCAVRDVIKADTGSGIIKMKGDFSLLGELELQTGSGSVTFVSTPFPELHFQVVTGCGRVEMQVTQVSTAKGEAVVRTGSGNIKIATTKPKKEKKASPD